MTPTTIATAADYADAMLTARRAKNWLAALLLFMLILQLTLFFLVRFDVVQLDEHLGSPGLAMSGSGAEPATQPAMTQPMDDDTRSAMVSLTRPTHVRLLAQYGNGLIVFLGMVFSVLLAVVLMLLLAVMLVGRLIGVSQVTSGFIWAVLLALLLFPWQIFFAEGGYAGDDFRIPGVFYTWSELDRHADFAMDPSPGNKMEMSDQILKWARFVGFPALSIVLLLVIQARSSRGLRMALGESDVAVHVEEGAV